ncbi:MAG: sporulation integral membrane protein YtvI [Fusobacteria bacterium]|nr:MAG: sporulation integral membrane protein YtvI [Fusobacteriota bacterium]KAF0228765.1 MAG: sporulation integral membrane protein [Fusobacteriota bacterium]
MNIEKRRQFIINSVFFAIIAAILYFSLNFLVSWLMPFIIGFIIAYLMNPLITMTVKKTHIKRRLVASIYTVTLALLIGALIWFLGYLIVRYSQSYFHLLPDFITKELLPAFEKVNAWINNIIEGFSPDMRIQLGGLQEELLKEIQKLSINFSKSGLVLLTNITKALPFIFLSFIFTVLATIFSNIDFPNIKAFLIDIMPSKFSILAKNIKVSFTKTIGKYLIAYMKIMTITFVELSIGLAILKVPNPIFIAFLIAIFDIFPVFGTGGIMVPWIIIAFILGNSPLGIGLLILYGVVVIVRQFVEPKIVGDQLGLNPLVALISIYLGFIWFGVTGMLIVPIVANIFIRLYNEGKLTAFINFEELYFDDVERTERKKKQKNDEKAAKSRNNKKAPNIKIDDKDDK